jgi:hypothetical protein
VSRFFGNIGVAGLLAGLAACAGPARPPCAPSVGSPMAVFTLYFGETIPGRDALTDKEWRSFLDATVTTNLPKGYTVLDAEGAWMNPITRRTITEPTKVLVAALPEVPGSLAAINRIRAGYRQKFDQQLVGMTVEQACGTF